MLQRDVNPTLLGAQGRERFLGVGLKDAWKVYSEEVALELRHKLWAEQKG